LINAVDQLTARSNASRRTSSDCGATPPSCGGARA